MEMSAAQTKRISKFLSLVLRHNPGAIDVQLDEAGWIDVDVLLNSMAAKGRKVSREQLDHVVASNDKQRFSFSEDGLRIRAKQGHSVNVDLGYRPSEPPETLCHGTPSRFVKQIRAGGLKKMKRHHVHMHASSALANEVGGRRGKPVLLTVLSKQMHDAGFEFFVTDNDVWLTEHVPPEFIEFPSD
jgi:putative RNA 2'-phosphotransferase